MAKQKYETKKMGILFITNKKGEAMGRDKSGKVFKVKFRKLDKRNPRWREYMILKESYSKRDKHG